MNKDLRKEIEQYLTKYPLNRSEKGSYKKAADKFGITGEEVRSIYRRLRIKNLVDESIVAQMKPYQEELNRNYSALQAAIEDHIENNKREIKTLTDLINHCEIDLDKYTVVRHTINKWTSGDKDVYQVKAHLVQKEEGEFSQEKFIDFLKEFEPSKKITKEVTDNKELEKACLLINKQDAHLNRYDINGNNDIEERFAVIEDKITRIIEKARLSTNVDKILYVVGSDEFNSEWTGMTTKFTPQSNIGTFWDSFELICQHEVNIINLLLKNCNSLDIMFLSGNHDEFVGWHMVKWLQAYFRNQPNIRLDSSV